MSAARAEAELANALVVELFLSMVEETGSEDELLTPAGAGAPELVP